MLHAVAQHVPEHMEHGQKDVQMSVVLGSRKTVLVQNPMAYVHTQVRIGSAIILVFVSFVVGVRGIKVGQLCKLFTPGLGMGQPPGNPLFLGRARRDRIGGAAPRCHAPVPGWIDGGWQCLRAPVGRPGSLLNAHSAHLCLPRCSEPDSIVCSAT